MHKFLLFVIVTFLFLSSSSAIDNHNNNESLKIGLALRGGGALGFAHIGALEVIDSLEIPIDYVAGTSMGGLVGALYSMGYTVDEMKDFVTSIDWNDVFNDSPPRNILPFLVKRNTGKYQLEVELEAMKPKIPTGLISGQKILNLFNKLTLPFEGNKSFDNLPIPFRCVGSDLVTGKEIIFKDGSLALAMRSTMSIPTVFNPVAIDSMLIVDGGMLNNFPTDVVKNMGANFIIGLNLITNKRKKEDYDDLLKVLDRTMDLPRDKKLTETINLSDININQNIEGYSLQDFTKDKIIEIISRGKKAALQNIDALKKIKEKADSQNSNTNKIKLSFIKIIGNTQLTEARIKKILRLDKKENLIDRKRFYKRLAHINKSSIFFNLVANIGEHDGKYGLVINVIENVHPRIKNYSLSGNTYLSNKYISEYLGITPNKTFDYKKFSNKVDHLYGLNYFRSLRYTIVQNNDNTISIKILVDEKESKKFSFGIKYDDYYKLVGIIGLKSYSTFIPGLYSELDFIFSGYTKLNYSMAFPSRSLNLPLYPYISLRYQNLPWDVFDEKGNKIIHYWERSISASAGIGFELYDRFTLTGEIKFEFPNVFLEVANIPDLDQREIKNRIVSYSGSVVYDDLDNPLIPNNGIYLSGKGELSSKTLGSEFNYGKVSLNLWLYHTFHKKHTLILGTNYRISFRDHPEYKIWFHVGGPETFVGWDYHQGLGSQFTIVKGIYRYRILDNFYISVGANTALTYSFYNGFSKKDRPLWGYGGGLTYNTLLGPVTFFAGRGDKSPYAPGEKIIRFYFMAGYKF